MGTNIRIDCCALILAHKLAGILLMRVLFERHILHGCGQHGALLAQPHSLQRCDVCKHAQNFRVRASDLSAGVYYVGVFNMDYFLHSPLTYSLQARRADVCLHL